MQNKNVLVASDSFKGTLSSLEICSLFKQEAINYKNISLTCFPVADGGEGSLDAVASSIKGNFVDVIVNNLYFEKINTKLFVSNNNAYIECASCVGLNLARANNNPGLVTTYGLGEQIKSCINLGISNIYIFLGGSASNDGGCGLASALGVKFYDKENKEFVPVGLTLKDIERIDVSLCKQLLKNTSITILSDVKSPFYGVEGAAYKFAKQKGANEEEIVLLDNGLKHLAEIIRRDLNTDISNIPGSGAAGGLGGGLIAFASAKVISGITAILDLLDFDSEIKKADVVISGEGKLDKQTFDGKVVDGVAKRCIKYNKELILIVGKSEISLSEAKRAYPCISKIYETNELHLPLEQLKKSAKEDYLKQIKKCYTNI